MFAPPHLPDILCTQNTPSSIHFSYPRRTNTQLLPLAAQVRPTVPDAVRPATTSGNPPTITHFHVSGILWLQANTGMSHDGSVLMPNGQY